MSVLSAICTQFSKTMLEVFSAVARTQYISEKFLDAALANKVETMRRLHSLGANINYARSTAVCKQDDPDYNYIDNLSYSFAYMTVADTMHAGSYDAVMALIDMGANFVSRDEGCGAPLDFLPLAMRKERVGDEDKISSAYTPEQRLSIFKALRLKLGDEFYKAFTDHDLFKQNVISHHCVELMKEMKESRIFGFGINDLYQAAKPKPLYAYGKPVTLYTACSRDALDKLKAIEIATVQKVYDCIDFDHDSVRQHAIKQVALIAGENVDLELLKWAEEKYTRFNKPLGQSYQDGERSPVHTFASAEIKNYNKAFEFLKHLHTNNYSIGAGGGESKKDAMDCLLYSLTSRNLEKKLQLSKIFLDSGLSLKPGHMKQLVSFCADTYLESRSNGEKPEPVRRDVYGFLGYLNDSGQLEQETLSAGYHAAAHKLEQHLSSATLNDQSFVHAMHDVMKFFVKAGVQISPRDADEYDSLCVFREMSDRGLCINRYNRSLLLGNKIA